MPTFTLWGFDRRGCRFEIRSIETNTKEDAEARAAKRYAEYPQRGAVPHGEPIPELVEECDGVPLHRYAIPYSDPAYIRLRDTLHGLARLIYPRSAPV